MLDVDEFEYRRLHEASPELLFDCLTMPEHLTHFWGPAGTTTPLDGIVLDLRPGGAFETTMVNVDGSTYTMHAVYVEIDRPHRLVWTEPNGTLTTITLRDLGDGRTEVITHQAQVPEAFRDPRARAGFTTSLDRFAAYAATLI
jgi:uncharacterized protein YndB with AHSA1/START domain